MRKRYALLAIALVVSMAACSDESGSPWGPTGSFIQGEPNTAVQQSCEEQFLQPLSAILQQWEDSLESLAGADILASAPEFGEDTTPLEYISALSPVLAAWEDSLENFVGDDILDSLPVFTEETTVSEYLLALSPGLAQWETALEEFVGEDILGSPPIFVEDTTAPTIECPSDTTAQCTSRDGAMVTFEVIATDDCDPDPTVVCEPPSGSVFPFGETMVTCTATDSAGNTAECTFVVMVEDTTAPVLDCPADAVIECAGPDGAVFEYVVTAEDDCGPEPTVTCDPPSGSVFPLGETVVTCTAIDSSGNVSECAFTVTVQDTDPPTIHELTASPDELWPPNHQMVDVVIDIDADDICSEPTCWIDRVTASEGANERGDGNTEPDWEIIDGHSVRLRAERSGMGVGRSYTVHVVCMDPAGNSVEATIDVAVPHDRGRRSRDF
ncbi:MAG: HYR domain-containing protein [Candidatus Krumholzibacteria bacterium]|nr:HYR domain-containing protein [Candidatus Krumholzibacteria bacterium]